MCDYARHMQQQYESREHGGEENSGWSHEDTKYQTRPGGEMADAGEVSERERKWVADDTPSAPASARAIQRAST